MRIDSPGLVAPPVTAGPAAGLRLPNFLVIGAAKAGTTSLYDWLRQHPQVFMPAEKEPHFFSYGPDNPAPAYLHIPLRGWADYAAIFEGAGAARAVGEASPNYFTSSRAMREIRAHLPGIRLIAALRNPAERAFSIYQMNLRDLGANRGVPFAQALQTDPNLRQGQARYLERWRSLFSPEELRVMLFDDIRARPALVMRELYGFLGVDPDHTPAVGKASNPGGMPRLKMLHNLLQHHRVRTAGRRLLPEAMLGRAKDLRSRNLRPEGMTPDERAAAVAFFAEDVARTEAMLDRDLSAWRQVEPRTGAEPAMSRA